MARNIAIVIVGPDGAERAVHRVQFGSKLRVDEGDKVKRGQRLIEWDPYSRPILAEVDGTVGYEDLVDGMSITETTDEATGISKRVVIDWRGSARTSDLRPALTVHRSRRQDRQARPWRRGPLHPARRRHHLDGARRHRSRPATCWPVSRPTRPRPATSPAVCRAWPSCSRRVVRRMRRSSPRRPASIGFGKDYKNKRRVTLTPHDGSERARIPDPQGQAHPSPGRRRRRDGRLHPRRQPGPARHPGDQGRRGAGGLSGERDPGGLSPPGRAASTTSTSRSSSGRCCRRSRSRSRATPTS